MKFRKDFVTNSSSSSFIMAFDTEERYERFLRFCKEYGYQEFAELVKNSLCKTDKEIYGAKAQLEHYYKWEAGNKLVTEKFGGWGDFKEKEAFRKSDKYAELVEKMVAETTCYQDLERLEKAYLIAFGTIWDFDGGLLEWALRNDFVKKEFPGYNVLSWNVG